MSPKATPVTSVSTTSQTVDPASRVMTSSASVAYSARNRAVVSTASTPDPCSSSASTYAAYGTSRVSPIWRVASPTSVISLFAAHPRATPTTSATTAESTRSSPARQGEKVPLTAAAIATWYSTIAVTSLKSPSPSRIDTRRRGSPSCPATAVAATGSGGATRAPSAKAAASGRPGTIELATAATASVVTNTRATASRKIGRLFAVNCLHEVRRTAAYSNGGSSAGRIRSGGMSTFGTKSSTASSMPSRVIRTGAGSPNRSPTGTLTTAPSSSTNSRAN